MDNSSLSEITKKGQEYYDTKLKSLLEPVENGKYVAIEVESGEYFLADTLDEALLKARERHPNKIFHSVRIGYPGLYTLSSYQPSIYGTLGFT